MGRFGWNLCKILAKSLAKFLECICGILVDLGGFGGEGFGEGLCRILWVKIVISQNLNA
ncbi:hypothetical protein [Helicobacter sp. T3_23-1056]